MIFRLRGRMIKEPVDLDWQRLNSIVQTSSTANIYSCNYAQRI